MLEQFHSQSRLIIFTLQSSPLRMLRARNGCSKRIASVNALLYFLSRSRFSNRSWLEKTINDVHLLTDFSQVNFTVLTTKCVCQSLELFKCCWCCLKGVHTWSMQWVILRTHHVRLKPLASVLNCREVINFNCIVFNKFLMKNAPQEQIGK